MNVRSDFDVRGPLPMGPKVRENVERYSDINSVLFSDPLPPRKRKTKLFSDISGRFQLGRGVA